MNMTSVDLKLLPYKQIPTLQWQILTTLSKELDKILGNAWNVIIIIHPKLMIWPETSHFPTGFNQFRKFPQKGDICFWKAKRAYKKTSLSVKSNESGFWRFWTKKLTNFKTRLWTRDMCHVSSEGTMSWALSSR